MNKLYIKNTQTDVLLPDNIRYYLNKCCKNVLISENFQSPAEISISFVDEETIKSLNNQFRNKDTITDVLSFPLGENGIYDTNPETGCTMLGDVVICAKRAKEQSEAYGHSIKREICFLVVHSILHLLGYDHETCNEDEEVMFQKQKRILEISNIKKEQTGEKI